MTVGIGLIGHGRIASKHAEVLRRIDCDLVAVMGIDGGRAQEFADAHGFGRSTTELSALLDADDVDAVIVASPSPDHVGHASAVIAHGKHLLCEIPVAMSAPDAVALHAAAAARPELVCMVCHTARYIKPIAALIDGIQTGTIVPISLFSARAMLRRGRARGVDDGDRYSWTDSLVWHHGAHAVDTAVLALDEEITSVTALSGAPDGVTRLPLELSVSMRTQSGRMATIFLSYNSHTPINELVVIAESGAHQIQDWRLQPGDGVSRSEDEVLTAAVADQDAEFVANIVSQNCDGPTLSRVLMTYQVLQRVQDAIDARPPSPRMAAMETP